MWAWATGAGALGTGSYADQSVPTQVPGLSSVKAITTGHYGSYALLTDGTVRAWGQDKNGQLGNGGTTNRTRLSSSRG